MIMKHFSFSKKNKLATTYIILGAALLLSIGVIIISTLLRNDASSSPIATTKIRAASLTYKRTITIVNVTSTPAPGSANASATATPTSTPTPTFTPEEATIAAQPNGSNQSLQTTVTGTPRTSPTSGSSSTITPTASMAVTDTPVPVETTADTTVTTAASVSTTPASTLPESGTVQYTSMIFITASIVLFISFLF